MRQKFELNPEYVKDDPDEYPGIIKSVLTTFRANGTTVMRDSQRTALRAKVDLDIERIDSMRRIAQAMRQAQEEEQEAQFRSVLADLPPALRINALKQSVEEERLILERDHLRQARLLGNVSTEQQRRALQSPPLDSDGDGGPSVASDPPIVADVSDRQIEALALRAIARFGSLPPAEANQQITAYLKGLRQHLPAHACDQIEQRAQALSTVMLSPE